MENWKRVFAIIWTGQLFSLLSSSIVNFSIILWLTLETGSAETLAYATIAALLPQSILGLFTGVFIDRWNRKLAMILSDSFIAFCTFILAVLFYLNVAELWHIYVLLGLRSVGSAFHMPSMQASVPLLAPESEITRIAGINQVINSLCNIAGPALGALFITIIDMNYILMLDVAGAIIACLSLLFVHIPNPKNKNMAKLDIYKESKEAIKVITSDKGLKWLFIFSISVTFFIMPVSVLFPLMTLKHFLGNTFQMGLIEVIWSVGALVGGGIMSIKKFKTNEVILINFTYVILGLTFVFSGILPPEGFILFVLLTAVAGVCGAIYQSSFTAILQLKIDPALLGRIFSIFISFSILPAMIGIMGTGFLADTIGINYTFIFAGLAISLIGFLSFSFPSLTKLGKTLRK